MIEADQSPLLTTWRISVTDSVVADEFLEDAYGVPLRISRPEPPPHGGALLTHQRSSAESFTVDEGFVAGDMSVRPDPLHKLMVVWSTGGQVRSECDGTISEAGADDVILMSQPHLPYRARSQDLAGTAVLLDPSMVASVASGLPSGSPSRSVRFKGFTPADSAAGQLWKTTVSYIKDSVLADAATATPLVLGHAGRMLAAVTLSTFPNNAVADSATHDRTDAKPVLLRRAIEFVDANAATDIALADIAEAVHVTPRAVQYMFRRHLETTPLQYLRRLRLHYAHQDLLAASHGYDTVTDIAARWGFAHTGRFAVMYRQAYGQSPHSTLRG